VSLAHAPTNYLAPPSLRARVGWWWCGSYGWCQAGAEAATGLGNRFWLDRERRLRDRAMFDLAIDSKLRGCDVVKVKIGDLVSGGRVRSRAIVVQQKTSPPVQFELLEPSRGSILSWLERRGGTLDEFVFPSRFDHADHISTRQYARLVDEWVTGIGLRSEDYGTHFAAPNQGSHHL
jgi:integrase